MTQNVLFHDSVNSINHMESDLLDSDLGHYGLVYISGGKTHFLAGFPGTILIPGAKYQVIGVASTKNNPRQQC